MSIRRDINYFWMDDDEDDLADAYDEVGDDHEHTGSEADEDVWPTSASEAASWLVTLDPYKLANMTPFFSSRGMKLIADLRERQELVAEDLRTVLDGARTEETLVTAAAAAMAGIGATIAVWSGNSSVAYPTSSARRATSTDEPAPFHTSPNRIRGTSPHCPVDPGGVQSPSLSLSVKVELDTP